MFSLFANSLRFPIIGLLDPFIYFEVYASPRKGWTVLLVGLLVSTFGGICFWLLMRQREQKIKKTDSKYS